MVVVVTVKCVRTWLRLTIAVTVQRQYGVNQGRCGVCGDPWDEPTPRKYEAGSSYTLSPRPVRAYRMGGDIPVSTPVARWMDGSEYL